VNLKDADKTISLKLPAQKKYFPLVQNCIEKASEILGLSGLKLMKLSLAVEEIFFHLVRVAGEEKRVFLHISPGAVSVDVRFLLRGDSLNLQAMNIVSSDVEQMLAQEDFSQMGLMLAASSIDSFLLEHTTDPYYSLILRQEKEYPEITTSSFIRFSAKPPFVLDVSPSAETLQQACIQALAIYPDQAYSRTFRQPGRFADLVLGGELSAMVLKDGPGSICGLLIWENTEGKSVAFHGPYIFVDKEGADAARTLVDGFISNIARSPAVITFTSQATDMLPMEQFEALGTLRYCHPSANCQILQSCYRHLREDHGEAVWAHPDIIPFLEEEYGRLTLARDIRETGEYDAAREDVSLFGVELDAVNSLAIMKPMLNGTDIADNISRHITNLSKHKFCNIVCIVDLGIGWQAAMCGSLMQEDFSPQLIQPLAGRGDCVVFQYTRTTP